MERDPQVAVTLLAALVIAVTAVWAAVAQMRTRPRRPDRGPATMDLGEEPPAVVDLITDDFAVTPEAVPATLVDLAARRWLSIEEFGGNVVIRIAGRDRDEPLEPYERRVLDHVRALAVDGVVPAHAMTTGPDAVSKAWWRSFRGEVIDDAQSRGLCRDRWSGATLAPIWTGTAAAGVLLWAADRLGELRTDGADPGAIGWLWGVVLITVVGLGLWSFSLRARRLQRDTDAGLRAAARWLGVRHHMATIGDFRDKPAAMVTLWDRYLAHAVALDLAPLVVAQLPLGKEDHRHAWSRESGAWRQVRVGYPHLRPGYGQHPLFAMLTSAGAGGVSIVVLAFTVRVRRDQVDLLADLPGRASGVVALVALALGALAVVVLSWNVVKLVFSIADVARTDRLEGLAIRCRIRRGWIGLTDRPSRSSDDTTTERFFVAFDTGDRPDLTAWRVRRPLYGRIDQGERYAVRVTPLLRYVRGVERGVERGAGRGGDPGGGTPGPTR
jgi:hypothetical protein